MRASEGLGEASVWSLRAYLKLLKGYLEPLKASNNLTKSTVGPVWSLKWLLKACLKTGQVRGDTKYNFSYVVS